MRSHQNNNVSFDLFCAGNIFLRVVKLHSQKGGLYKYSARAVFCLPKGEKYVLVLMRYYWVECKLIIAKGINIATYQFLYS